MRENIYYWKCDSPLGAADARQLFFKEKYAKIDLAPLVNEAFAAWRGEKPLKIVPAGCDGNHFAYIVTLSDGSRFFFRGDDGLTGDDYMIAENFVLAEAGRRGLPVPRVHFSATGGPGRRMRYQVLDFMDFKPLNSYYKAGTLDIPAVAFQLGQHLRRLHEIKCDGFGFFNTELLQSGGALTGLWASYRDYFNTRLDEHLAYLDRHEIVGRSDVQNIRGILRDASALLDLARGALVHRDAALWNVLGTQTRVEAIIDWDDCVSGDPADDLGVLGCFHGDDFMLPLLEGYGAAAQDSSFQARIKLHTLRNLLWKAKLRHSLGYFDRDESFFLVNSSNAGSLRQFTVDKILATASFFRSAP